MTYLETRKQHVKGHTRRDKKGKSRRVKPYDRMVEVGVISKKEKAQTQGRRTARAVNADARKTGKIAVDERAWKRSPEKYDIKGVDTKGKGRRKPKGKK